MRHAEKSSRAMAGAKLDVAQTPLPPLNLESGDILNNISQNQPRALCLLMTFISSLYHSLVICRPLDFHIFILR
jgi:hypothetical protein